MKRASFILGFFFSSNYAFCQSLQAPEITETPAQASTMYLPYFSANDGGIAMIESVPAYQCVNSLTPSVDLENYGSNDLTTATIEYFVDSDPPTDFYWSGLLVPGSVETVMLPLLTLDPGSHVLHVAITEANGTADIYGQNDASIQFNIVGASALPPTEQGFEEVAMPDGYFISNPDNDASWKIYSGAGGYNLSYQCIQMEFYTSLPNSIDDLFLKNVDLSQLQHPLITFDLAYAYYSENYFDRLQVMSSTDCGATWAAIYDKSENDLQTATATDIYFIPNEHQWREEAIDLSPLAGNSNVLLKFEATSGHGNNLYIDNIKIASPVGLPSPENTFNLFLSPNPVSNQLHLIATEDAPKNLSVFIINSTGHPVYSTVLPINGLELNITDWASGLYTCCFLLQGKIIAEKNFAVQ